MGWWQEADLWSVGWGVAGLMAGMMRTVVVVWLVVGLIAGCGAGKTETTGRSGVSVPPASSPAGTEKTAEPTASKPPVKQHVLVIEATGTARISLLTFTLDGKTTQQKAVRLPWRKSVSVPFGTGNHEWKLTMKYGSGNLFATSTVDGQLLTQTGGSSSGGGTSNAELSGSFSD